ncbi:unnamed protein product [Miscanthus lutarioriparius]|uniref:Uncharacterized protein n=1 Tax=Miscanthus lutarioriparius TaxID=422564 RepID=A0A811QKL5_9POAL|nr:unnamed protein product [Miscanthus lutarioriparius]
MGRRTKPSSSSSFWYSSRSRSSSAPATPRPEPATATGEPPVGCMSMVHYLIFAPGAGCVGRPPTSSSNAIVTPHGCHGLGGNATSNHRGDSSSSSKSGFEAPRNSLDLDADNPNDIQIEPVFDALASTTTSMRRSTKPTAPSSEAETPRTPSLVARLMGIDGLPEQQPSPPPAQHKKQPGRTGRRSTASTGKENSSCGSPPASKAEKKKRVIPESMNRREPLRSLSCNVVGAEARSLPEPDTPRASTSARASWDGPRLSLQALKENVLDRAAHYMSMPSSPTSLSSSAKKKKKKDAACSRRRRDEKAAKEHAREILRQAKETVASRKSGNNSTSASPAAEKRTSCFNNKENVMMSNPAAPAPAPAMEVQKLSVVFQQTAKPTTVAPKPSAEHHSPRVALAPRQQQQPSSPPPPHRAKPSRPPPPPPPLDPTPTRARKPDGCERFATRIKKPAACPASAPTTSSSSLPTDCCSARARVSSSPPLEEDPEYSYLRTVLERGGFMRSSTPPRRPGRGHSVASPVDPIVFHLLELELPADEARLGPLRHRWNRKLLFHLAQE